MKHLFYSIFAIVLIASACNSGGTKSDSKEGTENSTSEQMQNAEAQKVSNKIVIKGENIWVRNKPSTGDVIMKLNDGDECEIIEKGEKEQIRGMVDYWYKIRFNGKEGWVYGSQTNLKSDEKPVLKDFAEFLPELIKASKSKKQMKKYIHQQIGVYTANNPGAVCASENSLNPDIKIGNRIPEKNIFNREPKGDFCEGYPGEKNGFYYQEITKDKLPKNVRYTEDGDIESLPIEIPQNLKCDKFIKVLEIFDEYHFAAYYFVAIDYQWYIICQNLCDCSA